MLVHNLFFSVVYYVDCHIVTRLSKMNKHQATPSHLFFQFTRDDDSVAAEDGQRHFDLASEPKQIVWYGNCNHELNAQARLDRVTSLWAELGLLRPERGDS
ncbi:MAG: hypothetical protein AUI01_00180 [Ktedonobacter sp. 13_2_20CM_2_56_8]|nr:MAG: hypothetical protein AUI01_00180 [Ktedonobacter sp. 13_2_20CM_2_56_8]